MLLVMSAGMVGATEDVSPLDQCGSIATEIETLADRVRLNWQSHQILNAREFEDILTNARAFALNAGPSTLTVLEENYGSWLDMQSAGTISNCSTDEDCDSAELARELYSQAWNLRLACNADFSGGQQ
jgi:hypothetical protein